MDRFETALAVAGGAAVAASLVAAGIYVGGPWRYRRYRPGRPFQFAPVWLGTQPDQTAGSGVTGAARSSGTGGASGRW